MDHYFSAWRLPASVRRSATNVWLPNACFFNFCPFLQILKIHWYNCLSGFNFHLPHFFADAGCLKAFWRRCFAMRGRRLHKFREGKRIGKLRIFHSHSVSACCVQIKTADRTRKSLKRLRTQFHIAGSLSHLDLELPCCNLIVQKHKSSKPFHLRYMMVRRFVKNDSLH